MLMKTKDRLKGRYPSRFFSGNKLGVQFEECPHNGSFSADPSAMTDTNHKRAKIMKYLHKLFQNGLFALALGASTGIFAGSKSEPLLIKGYQTYTNVGFINPANPAILEVRTGGEGGLAHLGKIRSWSDDQEGNLVTGELTATYTFEDIRGNRLFMSALGTSAFQPDGRITFSGTLTITGGTCRFRNAHGILRFDGWARTTDPATGIGIGFTTLEGTIHGTHIERAKPISIAEEGSAIFTPPDFIYNGSGVISRFGRFDSIVENTPGPFNGVFVGIINGQFTLASSFEAVATLRDGSQMLWSGIEFVYFNMIVLPDGSPAPDLSTPRTGQVYQTLEGGTGRVKGAEGVLFEEIAFAPIAPLHVQAEVEGTGYISR